MLYDKRGGISFQAMKYQSGAEPKSPFSLQITSNFAG
jgi:hypothetical protein